MNHLYVSWGGENISKYCKKKIENLSFGIFWTETPTKAASCNALRKASASKLDKAKSNFLDEGQLVVVEKNNHFRTESKSLSHN